MKTVTLAQHEFGNLVNTMFALVFTLLPCIPSPLHRLYGALLLVSLLSRCFHKKKQCFDVFVGWPVLAVGRLLQQVVSLLLCATCVVETLDSFLPATFSSFWLPWPRSAADVCFANPVAKRILSSLWGLLPEPVCRS